MKTNRQLPVPGNASGASMPVRHLLNLAVCAALSSNLAYANPHGAMISNGQVTIDTSTHGVMTITNSPNAIIHWQNFNIAHNEITRFVQENSQSVVLNRIMGGDPSQIFGQLLSNGKVLLINPNGIVFGPHSSVDTQGLLASSLNLTDQDFLTGNYHFVAGSGTGNIVNEGLIRAGKDGSIILIAPSITNNGIIKSEGGHVTLAAGQELVLTNLDEPDIRFAIQAPADTALNLGKLLADGGVVNLFAGTIKQQGEINVDSVEVDAQGQVRLVAQQTVDIGQTSKISADNSHGNAGNVLVESKTGTVLVRGDIKANAAQAGKGGDIELLGAQVGVLAAKVTANGADGGGNVLVGGGLHGADPQVANAKASFVGAKASLSADAKTQGNGGEVVVWSDNSTRVYGHLSAQGGVQGGNGGLVETSGHALDTSGIKVDAHAPKGKGGQWLLDPDNVTIANTTGNTNISGGPNWSPTAGDAVLSTSSIDAALNNGTSVTVSTGSAGTQAGNITVTGEIDKTSGGAASLTLTANHHIEIDAPIKVLPPTAGTIGGLDLNLASAAGRVIVDIHDAIQLNGGTLALVGEGSINNFSHASVQDIALTGGGTFNNQAGAMVTVADAIQLSGGHFYNQGTVSHAGGSLAIQFATDGSHGWFSNNAGGQVNAQQLALTGGGAFSNKADGKVSAANITLDNTSLFGNLSGGTVNVSGTVHVTGGANFINHSTIDHSGGILAIQFAIDGSLGGFYNRSGGLIKAQELSLTGNGVFNNQEGGIVKITDAIQLASGASFGNRSTIDGTGSTLAIRLATDGSPGEFNNSSGGVINAQNLSLTGNNVFGNQAGGVINVTDAIPVDTVTFRNYGTLNLLGGGGGSVLLGGGTFDNGAGGIINIALTDAKQWNANTFNNAGILNLSGKGASLQINGAGNDKGDYAIGGKASLLFSTNGERTFSNGATIGGVNDGSAGQVTFAGGGAYHFYSGVTYHASITDIAAATVKFDTGNTIVLPTLVINDKAATLKSNDAIQVSKRMDFTVGLFDGKGTLTTLATAATYLDKDTTLLYKNWNNYGHVQLFGGGVTTSFASSSLKISPVQWDNYGTITWRGDIAVPSGFGSAINLTNEVGGEVNIIGNNSATLGLLNLASFNNAGTVNLIRGILQISSPGTDTGSYHVASAGQLEFKDASRTFNGAAIHSVGSKPIVFSGGSVLFDGGSQLAVAQTLLEGGGVLNIHNTMNVDKLTVDNGTINNLAGLTTTGLFNWAGGTLAGSGNYQFNNGFAYTGGTMAATGNVDIIDHSRVLSLPAMPSIGSLSAQSAGRLVLTGDIAASQANNAIDLVAKVKFDNGIGARLSTPNGRWLIYGNNPANTILGGLTANFVHFGCTPSTCKDDFAVPASGNGLLYSTASKGGGGGGSGGGGSSGSGAGSETELKGEGNDLAVTDVLVVTGQPQVNLPINSPSAPPGADGGTTEQRNSHKQCQ